MISVSVPGKIHLMGEHAVVYGSPALLTTINKRLTVTIKKSTDTPYIRRSLGEGGPAPSVSGVIPATEPESISSNETMKQYNNSMLDVPEEAKECVAYAIDCVKKHLDIQEHEPFTLSLTSDIPFGYHLGSSAALAVGVVGATMYFLRKVWNPTEINKIAYEVEKKQHGNPSGGDNTAVTFGGWIWYRKELEFLKSMWQVELSFPETLNHFYILNTGKPVESTGEMVAAVKKRVQSDEANMSKQFERNELCTKKIATAIKNGNEKEMIEAIVEGENTLEHMGVVSQKVLPCLRGVEKAGGAVKILGGGGAAEGVGFLLCYHNDEQIIKKISETYGYPYEKITLGTEGAKLESNS